LGIVRWGLPGFVLGAVFWNFVGIWQFAVAVVLPVPPSPSAVGMNGQAGCTSLTLDRATSQTWAEPCRAPIPDMLTAQLPHRAPAPAAARLH
jgi:hypothetical protein